MDDITFLCLYILAGNNFEIDILIGTQKIIDVFSFGSAVIIMVMCCHPACQIPDVPTQTVENV
jgi:hypothetical protein